MASALLAWLEGTGRPSSARCRLFFRRKCIHVDPHSGRVVTRDHKGGLHSAVYDLVVGCDGAGSVARQAVLQQSEVTSEIYTLPRLWRFAAIDVGRAFEGRMAVWRLDGCRGGCWSMPTGRVHIVFFWRTADDPQRLGPSLLRTKDRAKRFLETVFGEGLDLDRAALSLMEPQASPIRVVSLSQYHHKAGKVVLAGDAAHTMSSALGQVTRPLFLPASVSRA